MRSTSVLDQDKNSTPKEEKKIDKRQELENEARKLRYFSFGLTVATRASSCKKSFE